MESKNHNFDWKGFIFITRLFMLCLALGVIGRYGIPYAILHLTPSALSKPTSIKNTLPVSATAINTTSKSLSQRALDALSISDVIPEKGKFVAADLTNMNLYLYQDSLLVAQYPILTKGRPGTQWETPSGFYDIKTKELNHFSTIGKVYMPYSMQFYGNYFIHGKTYYPNGTPTASTFSGGCIRLETADAEKLFAFADIGTKVFVYDPKKTTPPETLTLNNIPIPQITALSYIIADLDTGDVYLEQNAREQIPIAPTTKLMTALVANEIISFDKNISVQEGSLTNPPNPLSTEEETFAIGNLLYPLLMQSNNTIADSLAQYYGKNGFVRWMNITAQALNMSATKYTDVSGASPKNISTPDDLFRLVTYLFNKKSFILDISNTKSKTITAEDGTTYVIENLEKTKNTAADNDAVVSILSFKKDNEIRRVVAIILNSNDKTKDAQRLAEWIKNAADNSSTQNNAACVSCTQATKYRKIEL